METAWNALACLGALTLAIAALKFGVLLMRARRHTKPEKAGKASYYPPL
jgi:hypothetical protein